MRVLVVDDDLELLELVERALGRDKHEVYTATSAEQALEEMARRQPDILVLDLGLPGASGEELCRTLRHGGSRALILILTAQSAVASRVRCLDEGADDYLPKPFAVAELRARVRALSRRTPVARPETFTQGSVRLDFVTRRAFVSEVEAPITAREWAILEILAASRGRAVPRSELLGKIWGQDDDASAASLEVLVGRIRRKLGGEVVRTVRGRGYSLGDG
ncbi:MAG: response regulator transcription factor [Polyangiaceae bacterium]|nr:response regulator transcription factor [Polyangiaceae bacterium]